jgi:hypothetical protein
MHHGLDSGPTPEGLRMRIGITLKDGVAVSSLLSPANQKTRPDRGQSGFIVKWS